METSTRISNNELQQLALKIYQTNGRGITFSRSN